MRYASTPTNPTNKCNKIGFQADQLLKHEEREPISPAIPEEDIYEVKYTNKRTNVVRLLTNGFQIRKLRRLANISAKLFNELNYERRQQFFHD